VWPNSQHPLLWRGIALLTFFFGKHKLFHQTKTIHYKKERRPTALRREKREEQWDTEWHQGEGAGEKEETDWEETEGKEREEA
jgi:hypothetical protein